MKFLMIMLLSFSAWATDPINEKSGYAIVNRFFKEDLFPEHLDSGMYEIRLYSNADTGVISISNSRKTLSWFAVKSDGAIKPVDGKMITKKNKLLVVKNGIEFQFCCSVGLSRIIN